MRFGGNDAEFYFEDKDFDGFVQKLELLNDIEYVHPPIEHSWGQRAVRFYDPDGHIIEVGENIGAVVNRFRGSGMNVAAIATRMDVREEYVSDWLK